jgi:toxin ParE1/3/4
MRPVLSAAARRDLIEIDRHSVAHFGIEHARAYLDGLEQAIESLAVFPLKGVERESRGRAFRCLIYRSHLIFYQISTDAVRVVRVLDGRRDWGRLL